MWIFSTSCTVILRPSFIGAINRFLPEGAAQQEWSYAWMTFGIFVIKGYHVSEYAVLCLLLFGALRTLGWLAPRALICSAGASILFAASDEWHQTFVPGRGGTWVDVCIDSFGVGLASCWILRGIAKQFKAEKPALLPD